MLHCSRSTSLSTRYERNSRKKETKPFGILTVVVGVAMLKQEHGLDMAVLVIVLCLFLLLPCRRDCPILSPFVLQASQ